MTATRDGALCITHAAMCSPSGDALGLQYAALQSGLSAVTREGVLSVTDGNGEAVPATVSAIEQLESPDAGERCAAMLGTAWETLCAGSENPLNAPDTRVRILLPPASSARGRRMDIEALRAAMRDAHGEAPRADVRILHSGEAGDGGLAEARHWLNAGRWERIVFGGVDSLVGLDTLRALAADGLLFSAANGRGCIPAEAAALVVLEKRAAGAQSGALTLRGILRCREDGLGLSEIMAHALDAAGLAPDDPGQVYADVHAGADLAEEWYRARKRFWQPTLPDALRHAVELGLAAQPALDDPAPALRALHPVFGHPGAARLPVQLALAWTGQRFERQMQPLGFPAPRPVLICESTDGRCWDAVSLVPADYAAARNEMNRHHEHRKEALCSKAR